MHLSKGILAVLRERSIGVDVVGEDGGKSTIHDFFRGLRYIS